MLKPESLSTEPWRLAGAPNFRDLGGYVAAGGRRLRPGQVFRSGSLAELLAEDLQRLAGFGIQLVCDLRSGHERKLQPSRWPADARPREMHLDVNADLRGGTARIGRILLEDASANGARRLMLETYRSLPAACSGDLAGLFEALADGDGLPAVIHCTAGKDRTGFICALLLHALGVSMEVIHADYLLSAQRCDRARLAASVAPLLQAMLGVTPSPQVIEVINGVDIEFLDAAFERIHADHGSLDAYLADVAGLDDARRSRLRARLLESDDAAPAC